MKNRHSRWLVALAVIAAVAIFPAAAYASTDAVSALWWRYH
ncbi:hypothetical protein [Actinokineospora sp. UTMC 2448]|nr:hypothetical protein [Actinokineospora sp. UTMC 2448]UVS78604.1 hypothetical protein Actkin_02338 [Actinokineospora sp. UTMC 2448]